MGGSANGQRETSWGETICTVRYAIWSFTFLADDLFIDIRI